MPTNRNSALFCALVSLGGCKNTKSTPSVLVEIDASAPMSIQLSNGVGDGTVTIPIRQVNSYGVGVPGGTASLAIRGGGAQLYENPVEFDAYGYATARVEAPDGAVFEIQVQSAERTENLGPSAIGYSIAGTMNAHGLAPTIALPSHLADAQRMVAGTSGVAVNHADEVWWFPAEPGSLPHQVADLPYDVAGMWSAHIDSDGIADLVIWAESQMVLLRGRDAGGYGWGGAWSAQTRDVASVSAGDVNGDRLTDLVVASTDGDGSIVEIMLGDGQWGFEALEPLGLSYPVESITAADDERDGIPDVTVLSGATGKLKRYALSEEGWIGGSPPEIAEFNADPGSTLLPPLDLNDKGAPEIIVMGPSQSGQQEMTFYVLGTPPIRYPLAFRQFEYTYADVDGDGADDVIALEDEVLNVVRYDAEGDRFVSHAIQGTGAMGPVAARDFNLDGAADIAVLTNGIGFYNGSTEPSGNWTLSTPDWMGYSGLDVLGPYIIGDLNGDQIVDIATIQTRPALQVEAWTFTNEDAVSTSGAPTLGGLGTIELGRGANPLAIVHCGTNLFALTGLGGEQFLYRFRPENTDTGWRLISAWETPVAVLGATLACGEISAGVQGVVVARKAGDWVSYDQAGAAIDSGDLGALDAIALADTNGDGVGEVVGCATTGCSITAGDLDGDGLDEVIESSVGTVITGWGRLTSLEAAGTLSVANIDDGARSDLLIWDQLSNTLVVHRGLNGTVAPAAGLRAHRDLRGPVYVGDVNGDGVNELVSVDMDGNIVHTTDTIDFSDDADEGGDTGSVPFDG
jgi:hypothetical protein